MCSAAKNSTVPRITVNIPEDVEEWLEEEAERLNWSKAETGGHCIEAMHSTLDHITSHQSTAQQPASDNVTDRLDELEARVAHLEEHDVPAHRQEDQADASTPRTRRDSGGLHEDVAETMPQRIDRDDAVNAVHAAAEYLRREGEAGMRDIVTTVMPEHPLGYDTPELEEGDRYRGAWWRKIVKPGLQARDDVESPEEAGGRRTWLYTGAN